MRLPWKRRKAPAMALPAIIGNAEAMALIAKQNASTATEKELAALELWFFYRRPPRVYEFSLIKPWRYALTEWHDRIGVMQAGQNGFYVIGDNGINYYAKKAKFILDATGKAATMQGIAIRHQWQEIEERKNFK